MSASFTGVSVVSGTGELCPCAELLADTNADYGYHLLVVQDYTATKRATPTGQSINSHEDDDDEDETVEAKFSFSFIDQVEKHKPVYIRGTKTYRFSRSETSQGTDKFTRKDVLEQSRNMKCDGFTIRCDVLVCNTEVAAILSHDICQHFNNLLQTKVGADVMFDVSGEMFAAHRCVLAARSTVFMAQLFGPMKEGTSMSSVIQIWEYLTRTNPSVLNELITKLASNQRK
ncbi:BTB/POZ and MATH domain-containing protein 2-like [Aegilops tauschii subsp. strangulata]|uniref:BTB/POZ and MATH domain-containing protein 2-like n=1 Tax=Aegilops tauschii subsp. strangulata TaxID=200361 RepID=UPI000989DE1E|nr:BTB/POZ and MATH domain-containing protein 2-like [Aegilops tauschii subsp. strangulata]